ncbi:hypothetical protein GIB67_031204 [Kingdonia uniflora]|uniref:F-box domain-containing protein n=1 Tax=Kingdonia uniflora TaxID=39325 RepID=A0A7J7NK40_9MAGN|nr:hypothetical protein GIB67_031204 [Kingdonia uniflora]
MALGKNSTKSRNTNVVDKKLGVVHCTGAMGKKRVIVSNELESSFSSGSPSRTPLKKTYISSCCNAEEGSTLEALPQDILVKILCGVDHEDLSRLYHVSKAVHEAALIAKRWHFAFTTPSSRISRVSTDLKDTDSNCGNGLKRQRDIKSRMNGKKLADITVALFRSDKEEQLLSDGFMEIDI